MGGPRQAVVQRLRLALRKCVNIDPIAMGFAISNLYYIDIDEKPR